MNTENLWRLPNEPTDEQARPYLTYSDKESYLAWVAEWKSEYERISSEIRTLRKQYRAMMNLTRYWTPEEHQVQRDYFKARVTARLLLWLRKYAKQDSWKMKQESLVSA